MARLNFLDRFRPAGSPGPAVAAGVPAVDVRGPEAELAPVFAALDTDLQRSRKQREAARAAADSEVAAARSRAESTVAAAQLAAGAARRRAYDALLASAAGADERLLEDARADAERIAAAGPGHAEQLAAAVVEAVFAAGDGR